MDYDQNSHHRRSIRLKGYDYSQAGLYFITICTQNRACLFGHIANGEMQLNDAGEIANKCWADIPIHFPNVHLHEYITMPNHIHGIIEIVGANDYSPNNILTDENGANDYSPNNILTDENGANDYSPNNILTDDNGANDYSPNNILTDENGANNYSPNNILTDENGANNYSPNNILTDDNGANDYSPLRLPENHSSDNNRAKNISPLRSPSKTIGSVVRGFKIGVTKWVRQNMDLEMVWQRNYYEHIIRTDESYQRIANYIHNNPAKWVDDKFFNQNI